MNINIIIHFERDEDMGFAISKKKVNFQDLFLLPAQFAFSFFCLALCWDLYRSLISLLFSRNPGSSSIPSSGDANVHGTHFTNIIICLVQIYHYARKMKSCDDIISQRVHSQRGRRA